MPSHRTLALACLAILSLLISSCIDGREEVWLNADGSGRAELEYEIPAAAARFHRGETGVREMIGKLLKDHPDSRYEVSTRGDRLKIHVALAFKSAGDLAALTSSATQQKAPASFDHLAGIFDISRSFRTVEFNRTISPGKAFPVALVPADQWKNRKLSYTIHLPVVPEESNATRITDGGRTLIWEQPLTTAVRQPILIHFKAKIPIPGWIIAVVGVMILAIAAAAGTWIRRRMNRPS